MEDVNVCQKRNYYKLSDIEEVKRDCKLYLKRHLKVLEVESVFLELYNEL